MKPYTLPFVLVVCLLGYVATGQNFMLAPNQSPDAYSSHEASFDVFGFYGSRDKEGRNGAWGPGTGVNYFFTQNIGAGADTYADAFETPYLLNLNGIFRYPIMQTGLAAYGFGGGGRQWKHAAQWLADIGLGIEYRLQRPFPAGLFFDAREVFPSETRDYAVLRFGLRFKFK